MRVFEGVEENLDKLKEGWFQNFSILILRRQLYSMENLEDLIDILVDI